MYLFKAFSACEPFVRLAAPIVRRTAVKIYFTGAAQLLKRLYIKKVAVSRRKSCLICGGADIFLDYVASPLLLL